MTRQEMDQEVGAMIRELPGAMALKIAGVAFFVQDVPDRVTMEEAGVEDADELLGFYRGIPLTERSEDMLPDLPDAIFIFRNAILQEAEETGADVRQVLRETWLHEVAHFFGYDDEELEEKGLY